MLRVARQIVLGCVVVLFSSLAFGADVPETLTFQDLVGHPERWPATVTMTANVRNSRGESVRKDEKLRVLKVVAAGVFVDSGKGFAMGIRENQSDIVEAANARWAKLTPAQRALDEKAVMEDASLWPDTVHIKRVAKIDTMQGLTDRTVPAGTECGLAWFDQQGVYMRPLSFNQDEIGHVNSSIQYTDLMDGARERAGIEPAKRASRLVEGVRDKMVDASGKPVTKENLDQTKVFVFYYGAQWCPNCHLLSPELVKWVNEFGAQNPHMTVIMLDGDDQPSEMFKYMNEEKMPWPAIKKADWGKVPVFNAVRRDDWPQLLITDKWGKVIYNEGGGGPSDLALHKEALRKLNGSGTAK